MNIKISKEDSLFSKLIRERDGKCVFCGKVTGRLQNSHFWGRGNKATRFHPLNCDLLCFLCHVQNEANKQGFYREWKIRQLGTKKCATLQFWANAGVSCGRYEKDLIYKRLKSHGLSGLEGFLKKLWPTDLKK